MRSDNLTSAENVPSWTFTHTVTHCPHGLPLPGPCSLCADGLRAPGTDDAPAWSPRHETWALGYMKGREDRAGSRGTSAWLGALLLLAALLLGAGIGWLLRGAP